MFGCAWMGASPLWCIGGAVALIAGSLFVIFAVYSTREQATKLETETVVRQIAFPDLPAPLLGERLVLRGLVSRLNLQAVLERQKGTMRPLGQLLIQVGLITPAQLELIREEQRIYRRHGFVYPG